MNRFQLIPRPVFLQLSLSWELLPFHVLIPAIPQAVVLGFKRVVIPPIDTSFLQSTPNVEFVTIHSVKDFLAYLRAQQTISLPEASFDSVPIAAPMEDELPTTDFAEVRGHTLAKRGMEIVAAGEHHVLLSGPPGCGKTLLANAFHTILPDLSNDGILETFGIYHLPCIPFIFLSYKYPTWFTPMTPLRNNVIPRVS